MTNAIPEAGVLPRKVKVLFAEDEVLLRLMVSDVLRESEFQVFEAGDAAEAISILRTTAVDVVITDMRMRAEGDGMQLATYARSHCPNVSLLLAAANGLTGHSPFDAFFIKPYKTKDIVMWIKRHHTTTSRPEDDIGWRERAC